MIQSGYVFAHATTPAQVVWHMQNCDIIESLFYVKVTCTYTRVTLPDLDYKLINHLSMRQHVCIRAFGHHWMWISLMIFVYLNSNSIGNFILISCKLLRTYCCKFFHMTHQLYVFVCMKLCRVIIKWNLHWIWIMMENVLVKWTPGLPKEKYA